MLYEKCCSLQACMLVFCSRFYENTDVGLFPRYVSQKNDAAQFWLNSTDHSELVENTLSKVAPVFVVYAKGNSVLVWDNSITTESAIEERHFSVNELTPELYEKMRELADEVTVSFSHAIANRASCAKKEAHYFSKIVKLNRSEMVTHEVQLENNEVVNFVGNIENLEVGNYVYMDPVSGPDVISAGSIT